MIVNKYIEPTGRVNMEEYVRTALKDILNMFKSMGADFFEEKIAHKVDKVNAILAGRALFNTTNTPSINNVNTNSNDSANNNINIDTTPVTLWKIMRIISSGDRMYSLVGTIVESAGMDEIAYNDLMEIMNRFSIIKR
jgi:hypothetical protein